MQCFDKVTTHHWHSSSALAQVCFLRGMYFPFEWIIDEVFGSFDSLHHSVLYWMWLNVECFKVVHCCTALCLYFPIAKLGLDRKSANYTILFTVNISPIYFIKCAYIDSCLCLCVTIFNYTTIVQSVISLIIWSYHSGTYFIIRD